MASATQRMMRKAIQIANPPDHSPRDIRESSKSHYNPDHYHDHVPLK